MGNRVLVLLHTDRTSEWEKDPELGQKISIGMNYVTDKDWYSRANLDYGRVVELAHADTHTLALVESYHYHPLVYGSWFANRVDEDTTVEMLRKFADKMGYTIRKKNAS